MARADLVALPVHPRGALVVDLHPVGADVSIARHGIAADDERQGDEATGVERPALQDGECVEINVVAGYGDLLAGGVLHDLGPGAGDTSEVTERFELRDDALGRPLNHAEQLPDALRDLVDVVHAQGPGHSPMRAVEVDRQGHLVALDVLEEQGGAAGLDGAVCYLGDFQVAADGLRDATEVAFVFQEVDEIS